MSLIIVDPHGVARIDTRFTRVFEWLNKRDEARMMIRYMQDRIEHGERPLCPAKSVLRAYQHDLERAQERIAAQGRWWRCQSFHRVYRRFVTGELIAWLTSSGIRHKRVSERDISLLIMFRNNDEEVLYRMRWFAGQERDDRW